MYGAAMTNTTKFKNEVEEGFDGAFGFVQNHEEERSGVSFLELDEDDLGTRLITNKKTSRKMKNILQK